MCSEVAGIEMRQLLGVPVHAATMGQTVQLCAAAIENHQPLVIGVVNAAKVVKMHRDQTLRQSVLDSDLILADGISVVWASWLLRRSVPERIAGIDLFLRLLDLANDRGFSVYFLGAEETVCEKLLRRVRKIYPNIKIAGCRDGYFNPADSEKIADHIRGAKPDMLFLGMTSPKKEIFMAKFGKQLDVPVIHGVGGSFDVLAGKVKRAPRLWQQFGLEWLYRVVQEPRRMWRRYLVTNTLFIGLLLREMVRRGVRA